MSGVLTGEGIVIDSGVQHLSVGFEREIFTEFCVCLLAHLKQLGPRQSLSGVIYAMSAKPADAP